MGGESGSNVGKVAVRTRGANTASRDQVYTPTSLRPHRNQPIVPLHAHNETPVPIRPQRGKPGRAVACSGSRIADTEGSPCSPPVCLARIPIEQNPNQPLPDNGTS